MKINNIVVTINELETKAFTENNSAEVSQIFRQLADRLDAGNGIVSNLEGLRLRDTNGEIVGEVSVDWDNMDELEDN